MFEQDHESEACNRSLLFCLHVRLKSVEGMDIKRLLVPRRHSVKACWSVQMTVWDEERDRRGRLLMPVTFNDLGSLE
jgi:hypothetical protein